MRTTIPSGDSATETRALVLAAQAGNRQALGELYVLYRAFVMNQALRHVGNVADAQELCQEVFVKMLEKIEDLEQADAFAAWLKTITLRLAINRSKRRRILSYTAEPQADCLVDDTTPVTVILENERRQQLRSSLRRMRPLDRETLSAFYLDGQSLRQMSHHFQAKLGTIKRRLHDARKRLGMDLEEWSAVS